MAEKQYNPLDKLNLGKSVAEALLDKTTTPLGKIESFNGAGIYSIYYRGALEPYKLLARRNTKGAEWPVYIGKAIPSGGRKGAALFTENIGKHLWSRLGDHAESIRAAKNLEIEDFDCKYLAIDDIWIPLGETLLIAHFKPVWNLYLEGFGNHDPGAGRYQGLRPMWDVLHPGRSWASKCRARTETSAQLAVGVKKFLDGNQPSADTHMTFRPGNPGPISK